MQAIAISKLIFGFLIAWLGPSRLAIHWPWHAPPLPQWSTRKSLFWLRPHGGFSSPFLARPCGEPRQEPCHKSICGPHPPPQRSQKCQNAHGGRCRCNFHSPCLFGSWALRRPQGRSRWIGAEFRCIRACHTWDRFSHQALSHLARVEEATRKGLIPMSIKRVTALRAHWCEGWRKPEVTRQGTLIAMVAVSMSRISPSMTTLGVDAAWNAAHGQRSGPRFR